MSSTASTASTASKSSRPRKWVGNPRVSSPLPADYVPLVRSVCEPAPYSVLDGVPIGSAVISMKLEDYMLFMQNQGYSIDELRNLDAKKIHQLENK